jgi:hypothetical protein
MDLILNYIHDVSDTPVVTSHQPTDFEDPYAVMWLHSMVASNPDVNFFFTAASTDIFYEDEFGPEHVRLLITGKNLCEVPPQERPNLVSYVYETDAGCPDCWAISQEILRRRHHGV